MNTLPNTFSTLLHAYSLGLHFNSYQHFYLFLFSHLCSNFHFFKGFHVNNDSYVNTDRRLWRIKIMGDLSRFNCTWTFSEKFIVCRLFLLSSFIYDFFTEWFEWSRRERSNNSCLENFLSTINGLSAPLLCCTVLLSMLFLYVPAAVCSLRYVWVAGGHTYEQWGVCVRVWVRLLSDRWVMKCVFLLCISSECCSHLLHVRQLRNSTCVCVCATKSVRMYIHWRIIISITSTDFRGHILSPTFS